MICCKCGDPVDIDEKFCNKCGNPIVNNTPIKKRKKKYGILIGLCFGISFFLILFAIIYVTDKKFYFESSNLEDEVLVTDNSTGKYRTAIVYDNTYSGVKVRSGDDAKALIVKDSVSQKNICSSEIKKIENEIISKYGITAVNLCEMDASFAKELGNVFQKIYKEFPSVKGYITNLTLANAPMSENYIAAFMPVFAFATSDSSSTMPWVIKTQVLLNTTFFLNKDRLRASIYDGSSSGHFPNNATIYSPLAHELGHYISFMALLRSYQMNSILVITDKNYYTFYDLFETFKSNEYSLKMLQEAYDNYSRDKGKVLSFDEWRGSISRYALSKDNSGNYLYDETIAEAFHDVYLNGSNAVDASKYIVSVLKEKLGG